MKLLAAIACAAAVGLPQFAHATLIDRGNGLIYDDSTNLTWMQDANYAKTSGYSGTGVDAYGRMNWFAAKTWAANLSFDGYHDWRLPTTNPQKGGFGLTDSELGHLFYVSLHNKECGPAFGCPGFGWLGTDVLQGPFTFAKYSTFWTSSGVYGEPTEAWVFVTESGFQGTTTKSDTDLSGWAVRDGDVASVPEPSSIALVGLGLLGFVMARRKEPVQKAA